MTPQELKNSILQLAIQGKLVEQRPEEGTAIELFTRIQQEKQRLIDEKKIKANKRIEPISDDAIPFDIPDSWIWIRFGNLVNYSIGKTPPRAESEWWGSDIPWVSIADMPESGHICETKESVTSAALGKKFGDKLSPAGTLLMSFKLTVGRVSILDTDAVHNEAIISIYPFVDEDSAEKMYLFYVLPFISQFGESKNAIKGKTLNDTSISNLLIPLPPLTEQGRIVAKIEELLPYIDRYEQAWSKLEQFNTRFPEDMKKSLLQYAIQGKLVEQCLEEGTAEELFAQIQAEKQRLIQEGKIKKEKPLPEITEDEKPFEIPESWKWVRLGHIVKNISAGGDKPPIFSKEKTEECSIEVLSNGEKNCGVFGYTNTPTITERSLTVSGRGTIGYTEIRTQPYVPIVRLLAILPLKSTYLEYLKIVVQASTEYGVGSAVKQLTVPMLIPKLIPLPPLAEQKRIVAKLEELLPLCERLK